MNDPLQKGRQNRMNEDIKEKFRFMKEKKEV